MPTALQSRCAALHVVPCCCLALGLVPWRYGWGLGGAAGNTHGAGWQCLGGVSVGLPACVCLAGQCCAVKTTSRRLLAAVMPLPACRRWGEMPRLEKQLSSDSLQPSLRRWRPAAVAAMGSTRRHRDTATVMHVFDSNSLLLCEPARWRRVAARRCARRVSTSTPKHKHKHAQSCHLLMHSFGMLRILQGNDK